MSTRRGCGRGRQGGEFLTGAENVAILRSTVTWSSLGRSCQPKCSSTFDVATSRSQRRHPCSLDRRVGLVQRKSSCLAHFSCSYGEAACGFARALCNLGVRHVTLSQQGVTILHQRDITVLPKELNPISVTCSKQNTAVRKHLDCRGCNLLVTPYRGRYSNNFPLKMALHLGKFNCCCGCRCCRWECCGSGGDCTGCCCCSSRCHSRRHSRRCRGHGHHSGAGPGHNHILRILCHCRLCRWSLCRCCQHSGGHCRGCYLSSGGHHWRRKCHRRQR
mmetsp:Transcript_83992/g.166798  ORF Transcript_83992/g.166798 Transcript_83992/m.166798 type:complete len:275 (+) Transcript_83992:1174-1998(+)